MPAHVRMGAAVAFVINSVFVAIDYVAFPEDFPLFLSIRLGLNGLFAGVFFRSADRWPGRSQIAMCLSLSFAMLMMVYQTGAAMSDYYVGLILLLVAMGVVFPLTAREAASICVPIALVYSASPLVTTESMEWHRYWIHLVAVAGASIESIAGCAFFDRLRFKDFLQRQKIVEANAHLKEMDRLKSRFTANIHHELRTPLTLILSPLESLLMGEFGEVDPVQKEYLETARRNTLRLYRLINQLLELSRIENRDRLLNTEGVDVVELVKELVANAAPLATTLSVTLEVVVEDEPLVVQADRDALEKVLVNLVGNALKFTEEGDLVRLRLASGESGVEIDVTDTGMGIPPDQLERVFDRFAQLDGSSTRRHEGSGIGLALARELVQAHGGRIWAESEGLGHGASLRVILPLGDADEEVAVDESDASRTWPGPFSGVSDFDAIKAEIGTNGPDDETDSPLGPVYEVDPDAAEILIVEDNKEMRRMIAHHLGKEFRTRLACNGREALDQVALRAPDLVVTDIMMPELSGTDLCERLKSDPATSEIPVILVTSKADREHKILGLELGADDYIQKPFHARELLARVRSLVRLHDLRRKLADRNVVLERTNGELRDAMADLRNAEAQIIAQERFAAVGELAAGIAHEINNPVNFACNAVRALQNHVKDVQRVAEKMTQLDPDMPASELCRLAGELNLLQQELAFEDLTDSFDELARIAGEGLGRTSRLVGDLREFASPRPVLEKVVDLPVVIESTVLLVSHIAKESGIVIERKCDEHVEAVPGNSGAISQVLLNVLKNAIDSFEGRPGRIDVILEDGPDSVCIEVCDDGPGIDPDIRERLFEPFFSTKNTRANSGLGLAIVKSIVEQHGGEIDVASASPRGTRFRVTLPR